MSQVTVTLTYDVADDPHQVPLEELRNALATRARVMMPARICVISRFRYHRVVAALRDVIVEHVREDV